MEWHLDAWDRVGGRAFASLRPRDAELFDQEESWGPLVFIGPPSFRPEPVASTAVALGACRAGRFQPRVPFAGEEAGFVSAEAVADFVRRAFVNAGTTRDDGGEGAPIVEGGPREPPAGGDGELFDQNDYLSRWTRAAEDLHLPELENGVGVTFDAGIASRAADGREWRAVESGALQLLVTVLAAFPGLVHPYRFAHWHDSANALYRALQEFDFWREWKQGGRPLDLGPEWRLEVACGNLLHAHRVKSDRGVVVHWPLFAAWLLSSTPAYLPNTQPSTANYLQSLIGSAALGDFVLALSAGPELRDRYDAMLRWPLPEYARRDTGLRDVAQLLMAFVSAPGRFTACHPRLLDIVAFAAALLSTRVSDRRIDDWRERAADSWLAESMPRFVFREDTESLIMEGAAGHAAPKEEVMTWQTSLR